MPGVASAAISSYCIQVSCQLLAPFQVAVKLSLLAVFCAYGTRFAVEVLIQDTCTLEQLKNDKVQLLWQQHWCGGASSC